MASSLTTTIKLIPIITRFLLFLLAFLVTSTAASSRTSSDVIEERGQAHSSHSLLEPRDPSHRPRGLLEPRGPKIGQKFPQITPRDDPDAGKWALGKFPGNWENSVARETPLGWEYIGCDDALNMTSPTYEDTLNAVAQQLASRGDESCVPKVNSDGSRCTLIAASLSASVYFCGQPGIEISCKEVVRIVLALSGQCAERVDGEFRLRGTVALFPGGWPLDYSGLSFVTVDGPRLYEGV